MKKRKAEVLTDFESPFILWNMEKGLEGNK